MHEGKEHFAIGLWTSLAGASLAGLAALAFLLWGPAEFIGWLMFSTAPLVFGLQISSATAGLLERQSQSGIVALAISIATLGLVVASAWYRPVRYVLFGLCAAYLLLTVPATAIVAGVTAVDLKEGRANRLPAILIVLATAAVFTTWPLAGPLLSRADYSLRQLPTALGALLLGPWVTLFAKDRYWPNFGEFFELAFALAQTLALAAASAFVLRAKRPECAAVSLILFAAVLLSWLAVGYIWLIADVR